jgi:hypothetical protein
MNDRASLFYTVVCVAPHSRREGDRGQNESQAESLIISSLVVAGGQQEQQQYSRPCSHSNTGSYNSFCGL